MLASGRSLRIGAGRPGALRRGLNVVYSSALDVKSFRICFHYRIVCRVYSRPTPPTGHSKYWESIFVSTVITV